MIIGIIRDNGQCEQYETCYWNDHEQYGVWFRRFFEKHYPDCQLIFSNLNTPTHLSNTALAAQANVILVSAPVSAIAVIREIAPFVAGKLVIEVASTKKEEICDALLETGAEFLQIHPMCDPPKRMDFNVYDVLVSLREWGVWREWIEGFLKKTRGYQIYHSPEDMDLRVSIAEKNRG